MVHILVVCITLLLPFKFVYMWVRGDVVFTRCMCVLTGVSMCVGVCVCVCVCVCLSVWVCRPLEVKPGL